MKELKTGVEVTVQMAIVVDTADGKYLISDILEQSINQSLTEPAFSRGVLRVTTNAVGALTAGADPATNPAVPAVPEETGSHEWYLLLRGVQRELR